MPLLLAASISPVPAPAAENPEAAAALALAFAIYGLLLLAIGVFGLWWGLTTIATGLGILEALVAIFGLLVAAIGSCCGSLGGFMALRVHKRHPAYRSPKVIAGMIIGGLCLLPLLGGLGWWLYEEVLR